MPANCNTLIRYETIDACLHDHIQQRLVELSYQSFPTRNPQTFLFHVKWLKEFKNHWFAVEVKDESRLVQNLAIDRI